MRFLLAILCLLFAAPAHAQNLQRAVVVSSCGAQALPHGPQSNLTMNPQGQLCLVGIAPGGFCSQAITYLNRTTGGDEGGNAANIAALICGLVSDGIITGDLAATGCGVYLDVLYIFAQQNQTDANLNLCGASYSATVISGAPSFGSYIGWTIANGVLSSGFTPSSATSPKYTLNSASYGVWAYANVVSSTYIVAGSTSLVYYDYPSTPNLTISSINSSVQLTTNAPDAKGLYAVDRSAAGSFSNYWNGINQGSLSNISTAVDTTVFTFRGAPTQINSAGFIGHSLGALNLALYNRLRTYMTAVGVP